ncbi:MAG TPA: S8 family peptidase [Solirubrobacteraceae bacterium]|nr:S8 family peptidase [Solirubrobacteraceae bacterium]
MLAAVAIAVLAVTAPSAVAAKPIAGHYIVQVAGGKDPAAVARSHNASPRFVYRAALNGFAAELTDKQRAALQRNPNVTLIEQDQEVTLSATQSMAVGGGLWGLDRIDQRALPLSGTYTYNSVAATVTSYVIDTGLLAEHSDFGGRARNVYNSAGGKSTDCNGHGTHVGGTIGGATYGVAKATQLRGVKVLGCSGSGSYSGIIAGVDWVKANAVKPAIANLSLGGGANSSLNTAVTNLANSGVFVAVAAGNESTDACTTSPASAPAVYTVAASDKTDTHASFSNFGSCVDGYAPGVGITSAWKNGGTNTISGTSMASPHVAGVAALYKGTNGDASQATVESWINTNATNGALRSVPSGTVNRLLFKDTL